MFLFDVILQLTRGVGVGIMYKKLNIAKKYIARPPSPTSTQDGPNRRTIQNSLNQLREAWDGLMEKHVFLCNENKPVSG